MAHRGTVHGLEVSESVTISRVCQFCQHRYAYAARVSGSATCDDRYRDLSSRGKVSGLEMDAFAQLAEKETKARYSNEARESLGVLCPHCSRFSSRCVKRWFPKGEKAAVRSWIVRDGALKVCVACFAAALVCGIVMGLVAAMVVGLALGLPACLAAAGVGIFLAYRVWSASRFLVKSLDTLDDDQMHRWLCTAYWRVGDVVAPKLILGVLRSDGLTAAFTGKAPSGAEDGPHARSQEPRVGDDTKNARTPGSVAEVRGERASPAAPQPSGHSPPTSPPPQTAPQPDFALPAELIAAARQITDTVALRRMIAELEDNQVYEFLAILLARHGRFDADDPRVEALAALRRRESPGNEKLFDLLLGVVEREVRTMEGDGEASYRLAKDCLEAIPETQLPSPQPENVNRIKKMLTRIRDLETKIGEIKVAPPVLIKGLPQGQTKPMMSAHLRAQLVLLVRPMRHKLETLLLQARKQSQA